MKYLSISIAVAAMLAASQAYCFDPAAVPAEVTLRKQGDGWVFADTKGMTLYTYDSDVKPGQSACKAPVKRAEGPVRDENDADGQYQMARVGQGLACAVSWPPLAAPDDAKAHGEWSVISREEGLKQWAFRGKPLYAYKKDPYAGATYGEEANLIWHVAYEPIAMPPGANIAPTLLGRALVNAQGMTLYTRDGDTQPDKSSCSGDCLVSWMPLEAPWTARTVGDWSVVAASDGTKQWAYQGKRLYVSNKDFSPGETNGDGAAGNWHAVVLQPPPVRPSWVTVQNTDMKKVYTDARGHTLYAFAGDLNKVRNRTCDARCLETEWRKVEAPADAKPVGNWSVVKAEDGSSQWAFKGNALYTFVRDVNPGDIRGDKWGAGDGKVAVSGGWWRPILRSCECSPTPGS